MPECECKRPILVRGEETCLKCGKRATAPQPEARSTAELAVVLAQMAEGHRPAIQPPRRLR